MKCIDDQFMCPVLTVRSLDPAFPRCPVWPEQDMDDTIIAKTDTATAGTSHSKPSSLRGSLSMPKDTPVIDPIVLRSETRNVTLAAEIYT